MRSRKLSEHVEDELFNKEKRNNEPKPVEVIEEIVEDVKPVDSVKAFTIGLIFGIILTIITINLIK